MARVFAITAATSSVSLDPDNRAEVSFTVSNTTHGSLRGRALVVVEGPANAEWIQIIGEAERRFAAGETHQYSVQIAVPPGAPAGDYGFRLDVISVANPSEDFTEGPTIAFSVAELVPPPPPPRKWLIAVIIAVVLLGGLGATVFAVGRGSRVPELAGQHVALAIEALQEVSIPFDTIRESSDAVERDVLIRTIPDARARIRGDAVVRLVVSSGPPVVAIPALADEPAAEAIAVLRALPVEVDTVRESSTEVERDRVIRTVPAAGESIEPGATVRLFISGGRPQIRIPSLGGQQFEAVFAQLSTLPLRVSIVREYDVRVARDAIIRTDPEQGTLVAEDTPLEVVVSDGPVVLPDVRGAASAAAAQNQLRTACSKPPCLEVRTQTEASTTVPRGRPIRTEPRPGSRLAHGAAVDLVISGGPRIVSVPNLAGITTDAAMGRLAGVPLRVSTAREYHASMRRDLIIRTEPASGARVAEQSQLRIVVSNGPVVIPNVRGLSQAEAVNRLRNACTQRPCVNVRARNENTHLAARNRASRTVPVAGSGVARGATVDLFISRMAAAGTVTLRSGREALNLDNGRLVSRGTTGADLWVAPLGVMPSLTTTSARGLVVGTTGRRGPTACRAAVNQQTRINRTIPLMTLPEQRWICVRTAGNRITEFRVRSKTGNQVTIEYFTW